MWVPQNESQAAHRKRIHQTASVNVMASERGKQFNDIMVKTPFIDLKVLFQQ
jgi:hypothetical protein